MATDFKLSNYIYCVICIQDSACGPYVGNVKHTGAKAKFSTTHLGHLRWLLLNIGSIRMYILMLDMFQMKQTQMYVCTLVEFILVEIWIHCCTKLNLN